jgi:hypothetical protein
VHSERERKDYTIARVWNWIAIAAKKPEAAKRDVLLNYGYLIENPKVSLPGIGQGFKNVALLPNCDLVIGPELIAATDDRSKDALGLETKEFRNDMIYLKRAMIHGTIDLNDFPKLKSGD